MQTPVIPQSQQTRLATLHDCLDGFQAAVRQQHLGAGLHTLAHRRPPRHDDQIRGLQPGSHHVEVGEAGGETGDGLVAPVEVVDALDRAGQQSFDGLEADAAAAFLFGDFEHPLLRRVQQFRGFASAWVVAAVGDVGARGDHLPQHRGLAHDLGVSLDVGRTRGLIDQRAEIGEPAGRLQLLGALQGLGQGDHVEWLIGLRELRNRAKHQAMLAPIEVALHHHVGDPIPGAVIQHETAEQRLFGVDIVRRRPQTVGCGVGIGNQEFLVGRFEHVPPAGASGTPAPRRSSARQPDEWQSPPRCRAAKRIGTPSVAGEGSIGRDLGPSRGRGQGAMDHPGKNRRRSAQIPQKLTPRRQARQEIEPSDVIARRRGGF